MYFIIRTSGILLCSIYCCCFYLRRNNTSLDYFKLFSDEEVRDLYSSPNIIRVIISRRMRWAGHVARMGEKKGAYRILVGRPEGR
jgi:hypothetical protein